MTAFEVLLRDLGRGAIGWQLAVLGACLAAAFGVCWLAARRRSAESVWFGRWVLDGVLFPLVALALTYTVWLVLRTQQVMPILRIALPVLVSLAGIRLIARVLTVVFPRSALARVAERLFSWLAWIAAVLWILGLLPAVLSELDAIRFAFGKSELSLLRLIQGGLSATLVLVVALWISATVERKVLRDTVTDLSLRKVAGNAIRAGLLVVGFLFALSAVGVDLTALSVLGGALGVGLGFGLQKLASNYVSGFVILFERSLRIGDLVRVDGFEGVVADIKTRYTLIRSPNGREAVVPNEKLITERVENLSMEPRLQVTTEVSVSYAADPDRVREILVAAAAGLPRVLETPAPGVSLVRFGADGLDFSLSFWIADPQAGQGNVKSEVNVRILKGLRAAGIDIPYPQRVVHLAPGTPLPTASGTATTG